MYHNPMATVNDQTKVKGEVTITLRGPDGKVKQQIKQRNLIVDVGENGIADQLVASPTINKPTHMAVGTGTNAPAAGDTTLQTSLDRNALTSKNRSGNVVTMVGDWAAGDATGAITEAGIFDAAAAGNMYSRTTFAVVIKLAGDTLQISWTFTVG